jgi:hypothetical protein
MSNKDTCTLYELFAARLKGKRASADSGAIFDLGSNALRPATWTSADAAGLPIFPGLVRYDEVRSGFIDHALRFTVSCTQRSFGLAGPPPGGSGGAELPADGHSLSAEGPVRHQRLLPAGAGDPSGAVLRSSRR